MSTFQFHFIADDSNSLFTYHQVIMSLENFFIGREILSITKAIIFVFKV
jgi:hypothetical protein